MRFLDSSTTMKPTNIRCFIVVITVIRMDSEISFVSLAHNQTTESHEFFFLTLTCRQYLEKGMATHSSILAWRIPWTQEPGGLQSMGLQRVRNDWSDLTCMWAIYGEILKLMSMWVSVSLRKLLTKLLCGVPPKSGVRLAVAYSLCHYFTPSTWSHSDFPLSPSRAHAIPSDLMRWKLLKGSSLTFPRKAGSQFPHYTLGWASNTFLEDPETLTVLTTLSTL